jgi:hypothetical protein
MRNFQIDDLSKFLGIIPDGLINRMASFGKIPDTGPGCKSIPKKIQLFNSPRPIPQTLTERRQWNKSNRLGKR